MTPSTTVNRTALQRTIPESAPPSQETETALAITDGLRTHKPLASRVPGITVLCKELDLYENARGNDFIFHLDKFRAEYNPEKGTPDTALFHWRSPDDRLTLQRMASHFLDEMKNGDKFWPDDPDMGYYSAKLRYSTNRVQ